MRRATYLPLALCALCALLTLSCDRDDDDRPLRIGLNPWPGQAFLHLAVEQGFFAAEGVEVRIVEYSSLADLRRAFDLGQIDTMGATAVEVLQTHDQCGRVGQAFVVTDFSAGADVLIGREPFADVAALRGRRIAAEVGSLSVYVLARALEQVGMTLDDVVLVPTNQSDVPAAMAAGTVDAAVTYPPYSEATLEQGGRVLFSTTQIPRELPSLLVMDREVLARRTRDAAAIVRAWDRAVAYALSHPEEAYATMAATVRMSPDDFAHSLNNHIRVARLEEQATLLAPGGAAEASFDRTGRYLLDVNQIKELRPSADFISAAAVTGTGATP